MDAVSIFWSSYRRYRNEGYIIWKEPVRVTRTVLVSAHYSSTSSAREQGLNKYTAKYLSVSESPCEIYSPLSGAVLVLMDHNKYLRRFEPLKYP